MGKIKGLNGYQKSILLLVTVMTVIFTIVYGIYSGQVGYRHMGELLIHSIEGGNRVYSGTIQGIQATFTVYPDKTTTFQHGDTTYTPYTYQEDDTAIPKDTHSGIYSEETGIELRQGDDILFRGIILDLGDATLLMNENGSWGVIGVTVSTSGGGVSYDENGQEIDPMKPTIYTILDLMTGPELNHKGAWIEWGLGVILCAFTAFSILFADELFRFHLLFRVHDVENVQPSDLEIAGRYVSWAILPIVAFMVLLTGLS